MFKVYDENTRHSEEDDVKEDEEAEEEEDSDGENKSEKKEGLGGKSGESRGSVPRHDELIKAPQYATLSQQEPFTLNSQFHSESVLNDQARELIWSDVTLKKDPIKIVSARYGVDIRRVAAVVRLKQAEKNWIKEVSFVFLLSVWQILSSFKHHSSML